MQTYSYIATVQVDFEFDGDAVRYDDARRAALTLAIRPDFLGEVGGTCISRVVVYDNEGAGIQDEMERD